jgi:hypothetical protein
MIHQIRVTCDELVEASAIQNKPETNKTRNIKNSKQTKPETKQTRNPEQIKPGTK